MPAPLRIILTPEEDLTLRELRLAQTVPQRTRDRAHTQLVRKLKQERGVDLSSDRLRRLLKKNSTDGNAPAPVIGRNKIQLEEQSNKQIYIH